MLLQEGIKQALPPRFKELNPPVLDTQPIRKGGARVIPRAMWFFSHHDFKFSARFSISSSASYAYSVEVLIEVLVNGSVTATVVSFVGNSQGII